MISRSTTFVLGAGASVPFGFPTGPSLRKEICDGILAGSYEFLQRLYACGHDAELVRDFALQFRNAGTVSIDSFLARRREYAEVGMHAMAACLLPKEQEGRLYLNDSDWLGYLWLRMSDGADSPEALVRGNRVRFITFNYDRTVEHFFYLAFMGLFGIPAEAAREYVSRIEIHHVYGSLGAVGQFGMTGLADIAPAVRDLRVMPDTRPDADQKCAEMLSQADLTFVGGFAFDAMNCARLGLGTVLASNGKSVLATTYGMTADEVGVALRNVDPNLLNMHARPLQTQDVTLLQLLRNSSSALR